MISVLSSEQSERVVDKKLRQLKNEDYFTTRSPGSLESTEITEEENVKTLEMTRKELYGNASVSHKV